MNERERYSAGQTAQAVAFTNTIVYDYPPVTMQMIDDDYRSPGQKRRPVEKHVVRRPRQLRHEQAEYGSREQLQQQNTPREPSELRETRGRWALWRLRLNFKRGPAMILTGMASVAVLGLGAYFLPQAVAAKSTVSRLEQKASELSAAYTQCAKDLKAKADKVDTYTQSAVDAYNRDVAGCTKLGEEKKRTIDELNRLYGK